MLKEALSHWDSVIQTTIPYFDEMPLLHTKDNFIEEDFEVNFDKFSWKSLRPMVERDIKYVEGFQL